MYVHEAHDNLGLVTVQNTSLVEFIAEFIVEFKVVHIVIVEPWRSKPLQLKDL